MAEKRKGLGIASVIYGVCGVAFSGTAVLQVAMLVATHARGGRASYLFDMIAFDIGMGISSLVTGVLFLLAGARLLKGKPRGRAFGVLAAVVAILWALAFVVLKASLDTESGLAPASMFSLDEQPFAGTFVNALGLLFGAAAIGVFPLILLLKLRKG